VVVSFNGREKPNPKPRRFSLGVSSSGPTPTLENITIGIVEDKAKQAAIENISSERSFIGIASNPGVGEVEIE
jgi:hypothetical protein